jgi:pimeloyl-ACP methyl ester carboxylesterase
MATYRSHVADRAGVDPPGFVVIGDDGDRIHFLDWGGEASVEPGIVLIHGLAGSGWIWAPVARRLAAAGRRTIAMDLRGHGLSDAPTAPGAYDLDALAGDVAAVAEGSGAVVDDRVVLVGHGFGAIVAAVAASRRLRDRCTRLVLVDGGLDEVGATSGMEVDEFLRGLDEPPEVMASLGAYLADRRGWDPGSWDDDQERAARAGVVETVAGRLVPATRPHSLEASVRAMFTYRPADVLAAVAAPVIAIRLAAGSDQTHPPRVEVREVAAPGHNLMRYRPDEVAAAILGR